MRHVNQAGNNSMKRWVFNISAGVSLLLCLAALVMWVRSYRVNDRAWYEGIKGEYSVDHRHPTSGLGGPLVDAGPAGCVWSAYRFGSDRGVLGIVIQREAIGPGGFMGGLDFRSLGWTVPKRENGVSFNLPTKYSVWWHCGFHIERREFSPGFVQWLINIPYWAVVLSTAILPLHWVGKKWRRARRIMNNQCLGCGYDLRASKDRCPECGTAIPCEIKP
jgi:hypothetical protein